jgi:hypothetical protein
MPTRYQGRTKIKDFYDQVGKLYADFGFKPKDLPPPPAEIFSVPSDYLS